MALFIWVMWTMQTSVAVDQSVLTELRRLYFTLDEDKSAALIIQKMSRNGAEQNVPLMMAYHGVATASTANLTRIPTTKLQRFREGRNLLEKAIASEPNNPEIRFLRLSMQHKTPQFLNYRFDIEQDVDFILNFIESNRHNYDYPRSYWQNVLLYLQQMNHPQTSTSARIQSLMKILQ